MKITEIIIDRLTETALFEMAFRRKIAINKARDLQNQIARHLIKLEMYADSEYVDHWSMELTGWLKDIQDNKLRSTGKPLSSETLFDLLFDEPLGTINDVQSKMSDIYLDYKNLSMIQVSAAEINKNLYYVLSEICADIANSEFRDIKNYLK